MKKNEKNIFFLKNSVTLQSKKTYYNFVICLEIFLINFSFNLIFNLVMKRVILNFKLFVAAMAMTCFVAGVMTSCDKELYTDADAQAAMDRIAQRKLDAEQAIKELEFANKLAVEKLIGDIALEQQALTYMNENTTTVTILVKDVTDPAANMSGFTVATSQSWGDVSKTTNNAGMATLTIRHGEALLLVSKSGYSRTLAYIFNDWRENETYLIPVVPISNTGKVTGTALVKSDLLSREVVPAAGVTLDISYTLSSDFTNQLSDHYRSLSPVAGLVYEDLFTPAVTDADGKFSFDVPKTKLNVSYNIIARNASLPFSGFVASPLGTDVIKEGSGKPALDLRRLQRLGTQTRRTLRDHRRRGIRNVRAKPVPSIHSY